MTTAWLRNAWYVAGFADEFGALAAKYSDDPSASRGGEIGTLPAGKSG